MGKLKLYILLFLCYSLSAHSSDSAISLYSPTITTIFHKLGDDLIKIRLYQYGTQKKPFFIALHDDEITAVTATQKLLERQGGLLVKIDNNKKRNIRFKLSGQFYTFDPNRIFSSEGIQQTLAMFGKVHPKAIGEIEKLAARILQTIPNSPDCIISLHNNTNDKFSITSYLPGKEREKDAKAIRVVQGQDPDDLFLTTENFFFEKLVASGFNVILQDNQNAKNDGSLSIYCGQKNIPYINCETEHGRLSQYSKMINFAVTHLKKENSTHLSLMYKFQISSDSTGNGKINKNDDIFFGDRKVGKVIAAINNTGEIEMIPSFPLYDNMDFFIFIQTLSAPRIEIRIDPTRPRNLYIADKSIIPMKVVK